jgi:hypothetical protein
MKRIVSLALAILFFALNIVFPVSCAKGSENEPPLACNPHTDADSDGVCDLCHEKISNEEAENTSGITVPEYKDYLRGTKDFGDLVYSRPDISLAVTLFTKLAQMISDNVISYEEQIEKLDDAIAVYDNVKSMNALATIQSYKNTADEFWLAEHRYISTNYPGFSKCIEELFVAAANSPNASRFKADFFGEELEKYKNGGIYTDTVVALMKKEADLEAEFSAISGASVTISYQGITDTYDNILASYKQKYGEESAEYIRAKTVCDTLYQKETAKLKSELLVELIRQRKLISDELGYESYEKFAYDTLYHDYSPKKMKDFIDAVREYAIPVYLSLSRELFYPYVYEYEKTEPVYKTDKATLINTLYGVYSESDAKLSEIYSYMLQHDLYDVEEKSTNRFQGSFTSYIDSNESPFLFVSLKNSILDYTSLAHEFGHFADSYINNNADASLDLLEVSSQALELLTLTKLDGKFDEKTYRYLLYAKLDDILSTIIFQSFYASFEISAYALDYDEISLENLNALVAKTAKDFGFSSSYNNIEYVAIPHIFIYPFYVQSYAASAAAAIEIYTREANSEGDGFKTYTALITRDEEALLSFEESLKAEGLSSPFNKKEFMNVLNELHYAALGAYYYTSHGGNVA